MSGTHHIRVIQPRQTHRFLREEPAGTAAVAAALAGDHPPVRSLYIHVPFCFHKCHYCDFYSIVDSQREGGGRQEVFVERLIGELAALAPATGGEPLETIFVGGGTPSMLAPELWRRLGRAMGEFLNLSGIRGGGADVTSDDGPESCSTMGEWTVECNPESATPELMEALAEAGVNRVSIGAQSFHEKHLKTLERWHDPANVERALANAEAAGISRRSIDLIFAIPGQTAAEWERDLETALSLSPRLTHLSCYNLTYEANTAMTQRLRMGEFEPLDEEVEAEMYALTVERLRAAGLERYEVSNYAAPGEESAHNLVYWRHGQWLAAGPSAGGHVWAGGQIGAGSHRWKNVARLGEWLDSRGLSPVVEHEGPDRVRAVQERLMMGIRLAEGVEADGLCADAEAACEGASERLRQVAQRLVERGWLEASGARWRLTGEGFLFTDGAAGELMEAVGA